MAWVITKIFLLKMFRLGGDPLYMIGEKGQVFIHQVHAVENLLPLFLASGVIYQLLAVIQLKNTNGKRLVEVDRIRLYTIASEVGDLIDWPLPPHPTIGCGGLIDSMAVLAEGHLHSQNASRKSVCLREE